MSEMLYGGAGQFRAFKLGTTGSPASAYEIQDPAGVVTTDVADYSLLMSGYIEDSNLQPQADGSFKGTINNYDVAEAIIDALNALAKKPNTAAGTTPAAIKMEHGTERGGSSSSERPLILWQSYGPKNSGNTKRLMHYGVGRLGMDSGQIQYKDGQWIKPGLSLESVAAEFDVVIAQTLWDPALVSATVGSITVPQYSHYERKYLNKGTA